MKTTKSTTKKLTNEDICKKVTFRIIEAYERDGLAPWVKGWNSLGTAANLISRKPYRGINTLLLALSNMSHGYTSPFWCTFKQSKEAAGYKKNGLGYTYTFCKGRQAVPFIEGQRIMDDIFTIATAKKDGTLIDTEGNEHPVDEYTDPGYGIRKGEKGTQIIFWKPLDVDRKDADGNVMKNDDGDTMKKRIFLLREYTVFNTEQMNLPEGCVPTVETIDHTETEADALANRVVEEYIHCGGPQVSYVGDRAFYAPYLDVIQMPAAEQFKTLSSFQCTRFHELVHSTGHGDRLDRGFDGSFGSDPYAKEELVAEIGAAMLCGLTGVENDIDNSAAYVKSWMSKLADDPTLIVYAAQRAQKAVDHIWEKSDD